MNAMKRTILDGVLLCLLSVALGFGINSVRGTKRVLPTKSYFAKTAQPPPSAGEARAADSSPAKPTTDAAVSALNPTPSPTSTPPKPNVQSKKKHLEHDYQEIQFEELVKVFRDPATSQGLNVFVDARKEDLYEEGHIPNALHCSPYETGEHLDEVVARSNGVERVIVYCGGGDCEDSIFLCRELIEAGVPYDLVFLYSGGWQEWTDNNLPVQSGGHE